MFKKTLIYLMFIILLCYKLIADSSIDIANKNAFDKQLDFNQKIKDSIQKNIPTFQGGVQASDNTGPLDLSKVDKNNCYSFNKITITGNTLISDRQINSLKKDFLNQCIDIYTLQEMLLARIVSAYQRKGYILVVPYLPEQNIKNNELVIVIKEDNLVKINYDKNVLSRGNVSFAFWDSIGHPVNIRYLEQALESLNSSGSYKTIMNLEPGEHTGETILNLTATKINSWHLSVGVSNDYNTLEDISFPKKEARTNLSLRVGNLLLPNDIINLGASYTLQSNKNNKEGSFSVYYSLPFGYWNISYSNNSDLYRNVLPTQISNYVSHGLSQKHSLEIKRTIQRSQTYIIKAFIKPIVYDTTNYFDNIYLKNSSYRLYYMDSGFEYQYFTNKISLYSSIVYTRGQPLFGEKKQGANEEFIPQNLFNIFTLNINTTIPLARRISYANRLSVQYTKDTLYTLNDFVVVGNSGVRGYNNIFDDLSSKVYSNYGSGFTNQNDITLSLLNFNNKWVSNISILIGADIGGSLDENNFKILNEKGVPLIAWYSELQVNGRINFSLGYGKPLVPLSFVPKNQQSIQFSFNISL